ncbi:MAG: hypothetical protein IJN04_07420 [Clostridia bacterium]|nr:hypothetical protein [Clostridia bacterium]
MFTYAIDLALALVAALMMVKGHYGITRQLAAVPLAVALLDAAFAAQLDLALTPVLSAAVILLQVVILSLSVVMLRQDALHARAKRTRRARRQQQEQDRAAFDAAARRRNRVAACA